jgi:hypothetical protein
MNKRNYLLRQKVLITKLLGRKLPPLMASRLRAWMFPYSIARVAPYECLETATTGSLLECHLDDIHGYHFIFHGSPAPRFRWTLICDKECQYVQHETSGFRARARSPEGD